MDNHLESVKLTKGGFHISWEAPSVNFNKYINEVTWCITNTLAVIGLTKLLTHIWIDFRLFSSVSISSFFFLFFSCRIFEYIFPFFFFNSSFFCKHCCLLLFYLFILPSSDTDSFYFVSIFYNNLFFLYHLSFFCLSWRLFSLSLSFSASDFHSLSFPKFLCFCSSTILPIARQRMSRDVKPI